MVIVFKNCVKQFHFGTEHQNGFSLSQINKMFNPTFCSTYDMNVQTRWEMYGVEKWQEGKCPGGKTTGGNMS